MTDTEIRASAINAASRLAVQNFQGGGYSPKRQEVLMTAKVFEEYIRSGEIR